MDISNEALIVIIVTLVLTMVALAVSPLRRSPLPARLPPVDGRHYPRGPVQPGEANCAFRGAGSWHHHSHLRSLHRRKPARYRHERCPRQRGKRRRHGGSVAPWQDLYRQHHRYRRLSGHPVVSRLTSPIIEQYLAHRVHEDKDSDEVQRRTQTLQSVVSTHSLPLSLPWPSSWSFRSSE